MHLRIYFPMRNSKFSSSFCVLIALSLVVMAGSALSQQSPPPDAPQPENQPQQTTQARRSNPEQNSEQNKVSKNHIFWVIPNYRADESRTQGSTRKPVQSCRKTWRTPEHAAPHDPTPGD
jgi:hypothetical protein